ncbi:MAG: hypothetical protein MUC88_25045 [Planctomycetes bacterium]|nr:hypothetical protein [Planctomycetota bacterium]
MSIRPKQYTVSGSVGLAGVELRGFPLPAPITDENGNYSVLVNHGWSGSVMPVKPGFKFTPTARNYPKVTANMPDENYTAEQLTFKISGLVGQPDVKLVGFLEEVTSDASGRYTATVPWGWSGTVIPEKPAWRFDPPSKTYNQVTRDVKDDYKIVEQTFVISGSAGAEGVTLKGLPGEPKAGANGVYRAEVKYGWTGKITPVKEGHEFAPPEMDYPPVLQNLTNQDFQAKKFVFQISGTAGMAGVTLKGLPGDPMTDGNGYYIATVDYGWTGTVTPFRPGFEFTPPSKTYPKVTASQENQDYSGAAIQLTIAGNTGTGRVTLFGLPGDPMSDERGAYAVKVDYNWSSTVTPKKDGFNFDPASRDYPPLVQNLAGQDYRATTVTFRVTGSTGVPAVMLRGLPTSVVSGPDGVYSVELPYGWKGTITPTKPGFSFEPENVVFEELLSPQPNRDFLARIQQHAVSGRVVDGSGNGVADVLVVADGEPGVVPTDATGQFELKLNHGWKGKVTFQKDGYAFTPPVKVIESLTSPLPNNTITGKVRMLTITDKFVIETGPIADVVVTATPGGTTARSDAKGVYRIQVPFGWTGDLKWEKEGFDFNPPGATYTDVREDIDKVNPRPTQPVTQPVTPPTPPVTQPVTPPTQPVTPPVTQPTSVPADEQARRQQIEQLRTEMNGLMAEIDANNKTGVPTPAARMQRLGEIQTRMSDLMNPSSAQSQPAPTPTPSPDMTTFRPGDTLPQPTQPTPPTGLPPVGPSPVIPRGDPELGVLRLHNVLKDIANKAGVSITWDATVKNDPVSISIPSLVDYQVGSALQAIVTSMRPAYAWRPLGERSYFVYRPISNTFPGTDLAQALQDISAAADVPIIPDPNVQGPVNLTFNNVTLEESLHMVLAGKPYVFKKEGNYYLVADRGSMSRTFIDVSETRRIRMNYIHAGRAKALLHTSLAQYVQAELPNALDPNDQGYTLIVTAPTSIIDRIARDLAIIDVTKRQVLLEARVVVMERGDLLNLGTEWGWPTLRAGTFRDGVGEAGAAPLTGWPWGVQLGYTPDRTFTESLMLTLNLLQENSQADIIANPTVVAQDGTRAQMGVIQEEWFMMAQTGVDSFYARAELQKIESGTVLTITPHIGDNNDITLEMAVEVSDSNPKARGSELPLVTRRTSRNSVVVKDGGTVAVAGLTENRSKSSDKRVPGISSIPLLGELFKNRNRDKASREVAVFVTAHLVHENGVTGNGPSPADPTMIGNQPASDESFRPQLEEILRNPGR